MNSRTLTSVCAALALVSAIVTANLWRELLAERELIDGLRGQLAEVRTQVGVAPAPRIATATASPAATAAARQDEAVAPSAAATTARGASAITNAIAGIGINEQDLLKDPEYRKARMMMLRATLPQTYPGLVEELGLGKEEAERLFGLLAENQMAMTSQLPTSSTFSDPATMEEFRRKQQALQKEQADALTAMLGGARYAQWQEYQQTRSSRMQANNYATVLAQAGAPLDSAQLKSVVTAMVAEQKSMIQDMQTPGRMVNQEAITNRQAEGNRRILEAAAPYLTPQQLSALRTQFEQQDAINRASARAREATQGARSQP
jgi:hypothetical protein